MRVSAALLLVAGCSSAPTSLDVKVTFDDGAHKVDKLLATLLVDQAPIKSDAPVTAPGGAIHSGDDFVVLLDDALDAKQVVVDVAADEGGQITMRGEGRGTVARGRTTSVTVLLGLPPPDGGADGATADLAGADLAGADLAGGPDLAACMVGVTCAMATEVSCFDGGAQASRPCAFGCNGSTCAGDSCANPGDATPPMMMNATTFSGDSRGNGDDATGSCGGLKGADVATVINVAKWSTLEFDAMGTGFTPALYLRTACGGAMSEPPLAGPCVGGNANALNTMCVFGANAKLVACGMPPGTYYTWLDDGDVNGGPGGPFQLDVKVTPVTLDGCAQAGNLLAGVTESATTAGAANNFTNMLCADHGNNSPDAVFFFAATAAKTATITVTGNGFRPSVAVRSNCGVAASEFICAQAANGMNKVTLNAPVAGAGVYTVIVDGVAGGSGAFTIQYN